MIDKDKLLVLRLCIDWSRVAKLQAVKDKKEDDPDTWEYINDLSVIYRPKA